MDIYNVTFFELIFFELFTFFESEQMGSLSEVYGYILWLMCYNIQKWQNDKSQSSLHVFLV